MQALIAAPLLMAAWPAVAPAMAEEAPDIVISIVTGLAPDDLLNVRTTASAVAKVETRLAGGDRVTNLGCNDVNGYKWCKIEGTGNPKLSGWVPARYLIPLNPAAYVEGETKPADAPIDAAGQPEVAPAANGEAAAGADGPAAIQPPPDLTARLGGVAHPAAPETPMKSAAVTAMQDAYGLALAAAETPPTEEIPAPAPPAQDAAAAPAGSVPVPTQRPQQAGAAPAVDTQTVAELPPQPTALAPGSVEVPCARYVGQPMERCAASVVRKGNDKADVTVTWPDGGTRVISFNAGLPASSNGHSDFRFTREGSLSMIRIGPSERFEITDTLVFGD